MNKGANIQNLKPFKKGYDKRRNLKGAPPVLPELKEIIARVLNEEKNGMNGLEALIRSLLMTGIKGNTRAAQELLDRGFGKSQQNLNIINELPTITINNVSKQFPDGLQPDNGMVQDKPAKEEN